VSILQTLRLAGLEGIRHPPKECWRKQGAQKNRQSDGWETEIKTKTLKKDNKKTQAGQKKQFAKKGEGGKEPHSSRGA